MGAGIVGPRPARGGRPAPAQVCDWSRGQFGVVKSWFDAGRPVEFHLYQNGGHGFGMGYPGNTANGWFPVFMHWLDVNGFLKPRPAKAP